MPAVDPFSASSRPMNLFDSAPSDPLLFASTLQTLDPNIPSLTASTSSLGLGRPSSKARQYREPLPTAFPAPIWTRHERSSSVSSEAVLHGSDEWMDGQLRKCIDKAEPELNLSKQGLTSLSTKIADLQNLVTFPAPRPSALTSSPRILSSTSPAPSLLPPHPSQSPGRDHFSADAKPFIRTVSADSRPFARTISAPAASSGFFKNASSSSSTLGAPRASFARVPSGLSGNPALLDSPTITETSEDADREERDRDVMSPIPSASPVVTAFSPRQRLAGSPRTFGRSHTRAVLPTTPVNAVESSKGPVIWLQQNQLSTLPSALFEISNLTVLGLAHNQLTVLPPAIGALLCLKELNIGSNKIKYLPSTILSLTKLENLILNPNPFLPPPPNPDGTSVGGGALGPLVRHVHSRVPTLVSICTNVLISPRQPSGLPPLLEHDKYEAAPGCPHPLLDAATMTSHVPALKEEEIARVLQSARSISTHLDAQTRTGRGSTSLGSSQSRAGAAERFPDLNRASKPDDAAKNPYFNPCPSPRHLIRDEEAEYEPIERRLFIHAAEERFEWREVHRWPGIPIKWEGCSPGCLAFLEQDEEEEWTLEEEDEEAEGTE